MDEESLNVDIGEERQCIGRAMAMATARGSTSRKQRSKFGTAAHRPMWKLGEEWLCIDQLVMNVTKELLRGNESEVACSLNMMMATVSGSIFSKQRSKFWTAAPQRDKRIEGTQTW
jgi:hypothetical protein